MKTTPFSRMLLTAAAMILLSCAAHAAIFNVTTTADAGPGSLRQAITDANTNPFGPHTINFNIPLTDPNYNNTTGVFTITLASLLPTVNATPVTIDGTTQTTNQGNTNALGPEIHLRSTANLTYGICFPLAGGTLKGMIITGFQMGVLITTSGLYPAGNCTVSDCYFGVNFDGSAADQNEIGVACYGAANTNVIMNNLISGNISAGIGIRKSNGNTIKGNKIGTDRTAMFRIPNFYGVAIDSASSNTVGGGLVADRNIISGNSYAGVAINTPLSFNNVVKGNYIGININGLTSADTIANFYGIAINDSYDNIIGGATAGDRNIISGNTESGMAILGLPSKNTSIKGNYIGTNVSGTDSIPNGNGILLSGASGTAIGGALPGERNIISGNRLAGIAMAYSGTRNNTIKGNLIGTDVGGTQILSNYCGIYIKSNANRNIIGGSAAGERNIISGNYEMGLCVEAADSNIIQGNYIGPDITGVAAMKLPNDTLVQANGLYFNSSAKHNIAGGHNPGEGNVISGNRIYGHDIYGNSSYNSTIGNYIGVDATGNVAMPNATGICVDGGSNNNPFIGNVISGNQAYGIFIVTTGTNANELKGNFIGTNAAGTDTIPNQCGLLLGGGAKYNTIGGATAADRNIISGNKFDGILVADTGTSFNNITGNYIGTNAAGNASLPNGIGIGFATKPSFNTIEENLISGNHRIGLLLYEHCNNNHIAANKIGVASDGITPLGNGGAGIVLAAASNFNMIGGPGMGNIIANHDSVGIVIIDSLTFGNTFSENIIYNNAYMEIDLFPYGVNANDPGDWDGGANAQMNYPVITSVYVDQIAATTTISGTLDHNNPVGIKIELFRSDGFNIFGHGGATAYLGSVIISDPSGIWVFSGNAWILSAGDFVTATATDTDGNTSELSENSGLIVHIEEIAQSAATAVVSPNPATDLIAFAFETEHAQRVTARLFNASGSRIAVLEDGALAQGIHQRHYDLSAYNLKNGVYFIGLYRQDHTPEFVKFVILK